MIEIKLEPAEILMAAHAGLMRHVQNIKNKKPETYGCDEEKDWQCHVEGALGEYVMAKYLNVNWTGKGKPRAPDVGDFDVRTRSQHWHDLMLHPPDPDERKFWLVTGLNGSYQIHGWIYAKEGKKEEYWKDPAGNRPAYFVPKEVLNQIS